MNDFRTEHDLLGARQIPATALYGIHTQRALENFPLAQRALHPALVHAYGTVKLACARANHELGTWDEPTFAAIETACQEMRQGLLDGDVCVDALQGGAGTSTNMNVNEVLTNRALQRLGAALGDYHRLSPLDDLNLHQSTNDTYPTALRVAAIEMLRGLENDVVLLLEALQEKEKQTADVVKIARTQYQDAVLITLGREMSAYAEAFARDRWRIYKCEERLRVVNLGGTAVGTTLGAPRQFVFRAVEHLREITGQGLARAENLVDATQNTDVFVEVSGILKALASNLLKVASDLRLMSSGPDAGLGEIRLPQRQAGSSIMPAKVNPVIPEAVSQVALVVFGNDTVITQACASGSLELNAFLPLIADKLLANLDLLQRACSVFRRLCVEGIEPNREACRRHVDTATATATALVQQIGYSASQDVVEAATIEHRSVREIVVERGLMTAEAFDRQISPASVMRLGSRPARSQP